MNEPTESYCQELNELRLQMLGATVSLCAFSSQDKVEQVVKRLLDLMDQADHKVKGNRSLTASVKLKDLQLMMASTLRVLLDHLESQP